MSQQFPRVFAAIVSGLCLGVGLGFGSPSVQDYPSAFLFLVLAVLIGYGIPLLAELAERTAPPAATVVPPARVRREFAETRGPERVA